MLNFALLTLFELLIFIILIYVSSVNVIFFNLNGSKLRANIELESILGFFNFLKITKISISYYAHAEPH